jgi:hypothetical protein
LRSGGTTHIKEIVDAYDTFKAELNELIDADSPDVSRLVPPLQALSERSFIAVLNQSVKDLVTGIVTVEDLVQGP